MFAAVYKHYQVDQPGLLRRQGAYHDEQEAQVEAEFHRHLMGGPLCLYDAVTVRYSASPEALPEVLDERKEAVA